MNSSWEKFKDFLYDAFKYLLIFLVIAAVALLVYWRLSHLFGTDDLFHLKGERVPIATGEEAGFIGEEAVVHEVKSGNKEKPQAVQEETSSFNYDPENPDIDDVAPKINVNITDVSDMYLVGKSLKDAGLIHNIYDFVDRVNERNLNEEIKSGSYTIQKGSSIDEIIDLMIK